MELQGKDIIIFLDTTPEAGTPTYKALVCEEESTLSFSRTVNKRTTKCGTKVGLSDPEAQITGTAVAETEPSAEQVSHQEVLTLINGTGRTRAKVSHVTSPELFYAQGDAYLTAADFNFPSDNSVNFSFTLDLSGTIDITPNP